MSEVDRQGDVGFEDTLFALKGLSASGNSADTYFSLPKYTAPEPDVPTRLQVEIAAWTAVNSAGAQSESTPDRREEGGYQYHTWYLHDPDNVRITYETVDPPLLPREKMSPFYPVTPFRIVYELSRRAGTTQELSLVSRELQEQGRQADVLESTKVGGLQRIGNCIGRLLVTSLRLSDHQEEFNLFPGLDESYYHYEAIKHHVGRTFGKILVENTIGDYDRGVLLESLQSIGKSTVVRAVQQYDRLGLLGRDFWVNFGLRAGAGIKTPEFLPALRDKFETPEGQAMLEGLKDSRRLIRQHITALLTQYAGDPARHRRNSALILRDTRPEGLSGGDVNLQSVMRLASLLTVSFNKRHVDTDEQLAQLDFTDMTLLSDGLLRLLYFTRREDLAPEESVRQFEQDMLHGDLIALMHQGARGRRDTALADFVPGATAVQRAAFQDLVGSGMPAGEAARLALG